MLSNKKSILAMIAIAAIVGCKSRGGKKSDLEAYKSIHKGGKTLLWYGSNDAIHICVLPKGKTVAEKSIEGMDQFTTLCGDGKAAQISKKEFSTMSTAFLSGTTFKTLIRGTAITNDYIAYANRATQERDLVQQTSAVALIMSQLEVLEYNLSKNVADVAAMDSVLSDAGPNNTRPGTEGIKAIYGDTYDKVKETVKTLETQKPLLEKNLRESATTLSAAMGAMIQLRAKFEGRISALIVEVFDKELKKSSVLDEGAIDYALFTNVAVQMGLLDAAEVSVAQTPENAELMKISCEKNAPGGKGEFVMKDIGGKSIVAFTQRNNCEEMILSYRVSGLACSDLMNAVMLPGHGLGDTKFLGDPYSSFDLCKVAIAGSTREHTCAPFKNSFDSGSPGIYVWNLKDQTKSDQFENGPDGLKRCAEHIARLARVEVASAFFRSQVFSNVVALPSAKPATTSPGQPANSGQSTNPSPIPESLPADSALAVDEVVAAMTAAKTKFNVDDATRDACLDATKSATLSSWSDIMAHYYCQFPVYDKSVASVRACFTGTLRGQGGYVQKTDYRETFDACINRFEFDWVRSNSLLQFQYIMMSQRELPAGKVRFSKSSQRDALVKFYKFPPALVRAVSHVSLRS